MKKLLIGVAICAIITIPLFAYGVLHRPALCGTGRSALLRTATQTLTVSIAATPDQQSTGLGGCALLGRKTGMYFPFSAPGLQTFWMKDMLIPIDIVWISQGSVVGVTSRVPFPSPGVEDALLPVYHSPEIVDAVLEVGAGMADSYGLTRGSLVELLK